MIQVPKKHVLNIKKKKRFTSNEKLYLKNYYSIITVDSRSSNTAFYVRRRARKLGRLDVGHVFSREGRSSNRNLLGLQ